MTTSQIPAVASIEAMSYRQARNEQQLAAILQQDNWHAFLAQRQGKTIGYLIYVQQEDKVTIESLAVLPSHRRYGLVRAMLLHLENLLPPRTPIDARIDERDLDAQLFLRACGYRGALCPEPGARYAMIHFVRERGSPVPVA